MEGPTGYDQFQQHDRSWTQPEKSDYRPLVLRSGLSLVALVLGAFLILSPYDNVPSGGSNSVVAASPTPTARPRVKPTRGAITTVQTATPTPDPSSAPVVQDPANASSGGDQTSAGAAPVPYGGIPENVSAGPEMLALRDRLASEILAYQAQGHIDVAVAVTDMQTNETISIGGNVPHRTGCTIMMFGLLAAVSEFQAGRGDPGSVAYSIRRGIGGSYPPEVRRLLDNVFGSYLTGTYRGRELMSGWGMRTSYFDHVPYYGGANYVPNIMTALETNDVFVRLYRGELFDQQWTNYSIQKLTEIASYLQYILPGRLPAGAKVIHKIGYYVDYDGWVNNDAGIVTFKGGDGQTKSYAISYFSQQARTEYQGYSFGARLSRVVWDHMAPKYGFVGTVPPPPPPPPTPAPPPPTPVVTETPAPTDTPAPTGTPAPTASPTPPPIASPQPTPTPAP